MHIEIAIVIIIRIVMVARMYRLDKVIDMAGRYVQDMTNGRELSLLVKFSIPMLIGNIFQQFYNMVDSIVVGNYVGPNALAAVGATGSINFGSITNFVG